MPKLLGGQFHDEEIESSEHHIERSYEKELFPGITFTDVYTNYRGNFYYIGTWVNGTDIRYDNKYYNTFAPFLQDRPEGIHDDY